MNLLVALAGLYIVYTLVGATILGALDDEGVLWRWYDRLPAGAHVFFWVAWPLFAARLFIHQASPHHEREP